MIAVRHAFNGAHAFEEADAVVDSLSPAEDLLALVDRLVTPYSGGSTRP
ncbi:MAG: hypothetical protein ACOC5E_03625 [Acidobacteriota bacterium]